MVNVTATRPRRTAWRREMVIVDPFEGNQSCRGSEQVGRGAELLAGAVDQCRTEAPLAVHVPARAGSVGELPGPGAGTAIDAGFALSRASTRAGVDEGFSFAGLSLIRRTAALRLRHGSKASAIEIPSLSRSRASMPARPTRTLWPAMTSSFASWIASAFEEPRSFIGPRGPLSNWKAKGSYPLARCTSPARRRGSADGAQRSASAMNAVGSIVGRLRPRRDAEAVRRECGRLNLGYSPEQRGQR